MIVPDAFAERRFGRIRISAVMLHRDFAGVQRICAELVPLRVEHVLMNDQLVIEAASQHFDAVPPGGLMVDYVAILDVDGVRFERRQ